MIVGLCMYGTIFAQNIKQKDLRVSIRKYWFVMLTKGPNRNQDSITAAAIQTEHLSNIGYLYQEGIVKVAGPFDENDQWPGLFIFDCSTKEEVENYLQTDKAVTSERLRYQIQGWHTSPIGSFKPGKPKVKI
ncbi:MAG: hypothetical protein ACKVOW_08160 [Chitinophagaceae bacterium]